MKFYTEQHEWVEFISKDVAIVGITEYAAEKLGDVTFVELPCVDDDVNAGDRVAGVESVKAAEDVMSPVGGRVIEVNDDLLDDPGLVNQSPELDAWFVRLGECSEEDLDGLMDEEQYVRYIDTLE
ncbi:MAG: glycine cleavage system protein GcvH [Victivallaceae bacterium]|nr:glycine cleavage system protein GcvH [Victivallaceae bacterium]